MIVHGRIKQALSTLESIKGNTGVWAWPVPCPVSRPLRLPPPALAETVRSESIAMALLLRPQLALAHQAMPVAGVVVSIAPQLANPWDIYRTLLA